MTSLVVSKTELNDILKKFFSNVEADEFRIEFDEMSFSVRPNEGRSVLDILASQAEDLGPEDMSENIDHYLYGLPKRD